MSSLIAEEQYPISFREADAKELGNRLKHRQSVNLIGLKRIGISNFLRFFLYHKDSIRTFVGDNREHLLIPIDLHDLIELEIYPFWTLTLKRIVDAVEKSKLPLETKKKIGSLFLNSIQSQDLFLLIDNVRQALMLIVSEGVLPTIFYIRFDRIAEVFTQSFFDNLKGLRDATNQELTYVFTSFRSLSSILPSSKTSLSVFVQNIYMQPATEIDMRIIYESYKKRYDFHFTPTIEKELFNLVNGNVQYLQLALVILNEKKNNEIKSKEELVSTLVHDERITLQSEELWESLNKEEKKLIIKLPKNSKCLPDPYYDEKVCWFIAAEIVKEIQKPLKQKIFDTRVVEDPQPLKSNKNAIKKADYWNDGCHVYEGNIVNGDTGDVIRKSLEALEKKYKEEAELLRKEREAEKLRQQTRTNVPPPIQQKPVEKPFEFRKILNIPNSSTLSLDIIKKAYRREAMNRHPDRGGSIERMMELFKARDYACHSIGIDPNEHFN